MKVNKKGEDRMRKKNKLIYKNIESLQPIVNVVNEAERIERLALNPEKTN